MFKKTLLAAAVAGLSVNALAADITGTVPSEISFEGAASETAIVAPQIDIVLGAEYSTNDVFVLSFTGGELDTSVQPDIVYDDTTGSGEGDGVTFGVLNQTANSVTVRITSMADSADGSIETTGATVSVGGVTPLEFDTASVLASNSNSVDVTYDAETNNGLTLDNVAATKTADLINVSAQFGAIDVTTALDGVIDVAEGRGLFEGTEDEDVLAFAADMATDATALLATIAGNTTEYTLEGSYSFLNDADVDTDEDGVVTVAEATAAAVTLANAGAGTESVSAIAEDFTSISFEVIEDDETFDVLTVTFDTDLDGNNVTGGAELVLNKSDFNLSGTVAYDDNQATAGTAMLTKTDAGEWTINGTTAHVPLFVNDSKHATVVTVANYTANTPDMELVIYADNMQVQSGVIGQAAANGLTNITSMVASAAADAGITGTYNFDVIINEQPANVEVSAQYVNKVSASRAVINVDEQ